MCVCVSEKEFPNVRPFNEFVHKREINFFSKNITLNLANEKFF